MALILQNVPPSWKEKGSWHILLHPKQDLLDINVYLFMTTQNTVFKKNSYREETDVSHVLFIV